MSALVPYGAAAIAPYAPRLALQAYKRRRLVGAGIRYASTYGPTMVRAASTIARGYRSYRMRKRFGRSRKRGGRARRAHRREIVRHVGEKRGKATAKKTNVQNTDLSSTYATRTLYACPLIVVPHTTTNDIDDRQRNIVNLRGIKLCVALNSKISGQPLYLNYAIVWPKNGQQLVASQSTYGNFFRQTLGGSNRSQDFGVGLSALEFHCTPINTDDWAVLMHKRMILNQNSSAPSTFNNQNGNSYRHIMKYVKIGRQVRFSNLNQNTPESGQLYVVFWCDVMNAQFGSASVPNALNMAEYYVTYFREPKG